MHVRSRLFILAFLTMMSTELRAQSIVPDCRIIGWFGALREANTIKDPTDKAARLSMLFKLVIAEKVVSDLTRGLDRHSKDVIARFVLVSQRNPQKMTQRLRDQMASVPIPTQCKGRMFSEAEVHLAHDSSVVDVQNRDRLIRLTNNIVVPIEAMWLLLTPLGIGFFGILRWDHRRTRRAIRHPCALPVEIQQSDGNLHGRLVDLSEYGGKIRLRNLWTCTPGQHLTIQIPDGIAKAAVVWSKGDTMGIEFRKVMPHARVMELLAISKAGTAQSVPELRRSAILKDEGSA